MKTDKYSLRDGAIEFDIEVPDRDNVTELSADDLVALANAALAYWSYRTAAKPANDGKTFSLQDVCDDLRTIRVKGGEPSKQDKELAEDYMKSVRSEVNKLVVPEGTESETLWKSERCHDRFVDFAAKCCAKWKFDWTDFSWTLDNVASFRRALRLAKARALKNADDI